MLKKRILSGIQANGNLHLGNYLGAIVNWLKLQNDYNCFFFLADLHAITVPQSPSALRNDILQTVATYLACGLEPEKVTIFAQSSVSTHAEMAWLLNCVASIGWMNRMTQFKDKAGKNSEKAKLGLYSYPVLMAADILLYQPDFVPVGDDQKQHLELTRDLAGAVNHMFGCNYFKLPEPMISEVSRIMNLRDGTKKMSKSDSSDYSRINLKDSKDDIYNKIKKAKTDSEAEIFFNPTTRPEISNLINIFAKLTDSSIKQVEEKYADFGCAKFKQNLAEIVVEKIAPIGEKISYLLNNQDYLLQVLHSGKEKAYAESQPVLDNLKNLFGFLKI